MSKSKMKSYIVGASVFCLSMMVGLAVAEIALRIKNHSMRNYNIEMWRYAKELKQRSKDPILGHEHIPNSESILQSVKIKIDDKGMRCGEDEVVISNPSRRILFLGSSITLGWGVEYDKILTSLLKDKFKAAGENVSVFNAGIGNYNTKRYVHLFLSRLTDLEPTDIVLHYFINDVEVLSSGGGNFLVENSQLAATLKMVMGNITAPSGIDALITYYKDLYENGSKGLEDMIQSLEAIKEYSAEHKVNVYLLMTPDIHQLYDYPFGFIHEKMKNISADMGFIFVDPLDSFLKYDPKELWAMPGDPHPNSVGHKIMADAIFDELMRK